MVQPVPGPTIDEAFAQRYRAVMQSWKSGEASARIARANLENLLEEAQQSGSHMNQGGVELNIGIIEGYLANFVESAHHFELARQHFAAEGAHNQVITCELNIGEVYRLQGNFARAQKFFHRAYEDAREINNQRTMANALTNEGQMWLSSGSYRKARECLNEAIEIARKPYPDENNEHIHLARLGILSEIYHALTQIALTEQELQAAWLYAKRSYEYGQEARQAMYLGYGNRAIADVITVWGEAPEATFSSNPDTYYKAALDNFRKVNMEGDIAKTFYARGNSLVKRGKKAAGAKLYQRALAIFSKLGMTDDAARVARAQMTATSTSELPGID